MFAFERLESRPLECSGWSGRSAEPYVIPPINIQSGFTPANQWLELESV